MYIFRFIIISLLINSCDFPLKLMTFKHLLQDISGIHDDWDKLQTMKQNIANIGELLNNIEVLYL